MSFIRTLNPTQTTPALQDALQRLWAHKVAGGYYWDYVDAQDIATALKTILTVHELATLNTILEHNKNEEISEALASQGALLRYLRHIANRTQAEAAFDVNVALRTWERWESEKLKCPEIIIEQFCKKNFIEGDWGKHK